MKYFIAIIIIFVVVAGLTALLAPEKFASFTQRLRPAAENMGGFYQSSSQGPQPIPQQAQTPAGDCVSGSLKGTLSAKVDAQGRATAWQCSFAGGDTCDANAEGTWQTCSFAPVLRPWPSQVSSEARAKPEAFASTR